MKNAQKNSKHAWKKHERFGVTRRPPTPTFEEKSFEGTSLYFFVMTAMIA